MSIKTLLRGTTSASGRRWLVVFMLPSFVALGACGVLANGAPGDSVADRFLTRVVDAQTSQADPRALTTLRAIARDLPRGARLSAVEDVNGDGRDDDGFVQIEQQDRTACVQLPTADFGGEVTIGRCGST